MRSLTFPAALAALALLAACSTAPAPSAPPPPSEPAPIASGDAGLAESRPGAAGAQALHPVAEPGPGDSCGAQSLQDLVGGAVPHPFPARGPVRLYAEGDPVTMDFNPQRVNVVLDRADRRRITAIRCG